MKSFATKRNLVMLLITIALGWLFVHSLRSNWTLHARLNLLLRGYVFCHLEDRFKGPLTPSGTAFVAKWVYSHDACVGYLNPYGGFVSFSESGAWNPLDSKTMIENVVLFYTEWLLVLLFVSVIINLAFKFSQKGFKCSGRP